MLETNPPTFDAFLDEAKKGNVVPVVRSLLCDLHTPVGAFLRICSRAENAFLFEAVEGSEKAARYSFLSANPNIIFKTSNGQAEIVKTGESQKISDPLPMGFLREHFAKNKLARRDGLPPFCGGAAGFLSFEAARFFDSALESERPSDDEDALWMFFRNVVIFDRLRQKIHIVALVFTDEAKGDDKKLHELYDGAVFETKMLEGLLEQPFNTQQPGKAATPDDKTSFGSNWAKESFLESAEDIKHKINSGECIKVMLSQKFSRKVSVEPFDIYRALRTVTSTPYMFFLKTGESVYIGAARETLVRCRGKRVNTCAVSGDAPRGSTGTEDWIMGEDLRSDEEEIPRHALAVDMMRGDMGRVAEHGTIETDDLMRVERYSNSMHLMTTFRAVLADGRDRFDALSAFFPSALTTGAPKIAAVKLINSHEPGPRGIFGGAVAYFDYADNMDMCTADQIIESDGRKAVLQAGAEIVADSIPKREYEETIKKVRPLVKAIELAEKGF